jgi:UDPglucose 6-dehydrogenase
VAVVSNPEFLREGSAIADSLNPDRVVVGADDQDAASRVAQLFCGPEVPVVITDTTTSELIKYASNAFLATKLTFVNTMVSMCEEVGADANDLLLGIGYDKRIGFEFLHPGPGWGGSCLPKDTSALVAIANAAGSNVGIVRAAIAGNEDQLDRVTAKIRDAAGGELRGRAIGVLGLSFKANTNDRRNSPAVSITKRLVHEVQRCGHLIRPFTLKTPMIRIYSTLRSSIPPTRQSRALLGSGAHRMAGVSRSRFLEDLRIGRSTGHC